MKAGQKKFAWGLGFAAVSVILLIAGLVFSTVVTWTAWEMKIEGKAFHCTDAGLGVDEFWTDMRTHQAAGDTVSPGWTWEKLERTRIEYELAFFFIWALSSTVPMWLFSRSYRRFHRSAHSTTNEN
ncbi:MAG: hypothetical protein JWR26_4506 [Pedosphaera sp.]|nr:hypothetical protein [Pedosphaera sp.]